MLKSYIKYFECVGPIMVVSDMENVNILYKKLAVFVYMFLLDKLYCHLLKFDKMQCKLNRKITNVPYKIKWPYFHCGMCHKFEQTFILISWL